MTLTLRDVEYAYPHTRFCVSCETLTLRQAVCVGLRGPNGSGKTTVGKLAAGVLRPGRGAVCIADEDIAAWPLGRIGASVGYLFQEPERQIFAPTVEEDVLFPLLLRDVPEDEARDRVRGLLDRFELAALADRSTFTLSRGEKQRLGLCGLLACNPRFLVLDEPTTGLDARRRDILSDTLRMLLGDGLGVLLIGHDEPFMRALCAEDYAMADGRLSHG